RPPPPHRSAGAGPGSGVADPDHPGPPPVCRGAQPAVPQGALARGLTAAAPRRTGTAVNVYVDSSVLLRMALNERGALREWRRIDRPLASELIRLECRRTIDRARIRERLIDDAVAEQREVVLGLLDAFDIVPLDGVVLERAAETVPHAVGLARCHSSGDGRAGARAGGGPLLRHPRRRAGDCGARGGIHSAGRVGAAQAKTPRAVTGRRHALVAALQVDRSGQDRHAAVRAMSEPRTQKRIQRRYPALDGLAGNDVPTRLRLGTEEAHVSSLWKRVPNPNAMRSHRTGPFRVARVGTVRSRSGAIRRVALRGAG